MRLLSNPNFKAIKMALRVPRADLKQFRRAKLSGGWLILQEHTSKYKRKTNMRQATYGLNYLSKHFLTLS